MAKTIDLPEGFVVDELPEGFVMDGSAPSSGYSSQLYNVATDPFRATGRALGGIGEAGLQIATGLGASAIGGLRGGIGMLTGDTGEQAAENIRLMQERLTYQPRTPQGQLASRAIAAPIEFATKVGGMAGKEIQKGGEIGSLLGMKSKGLAGEAIGEAAVPIAATLMMGKAPIKSVATTQFKKPVVNMPHIPVVSDVATGMRDVLRTRTQAGRDKLAAEYLQSLTTPDEAVKIVRGLESRGGEVVPGSKVTSAEAIARANRQLELLGRPERFGSQYITLQEGLSTVKETTAGLNTIKLLQEKAREDVLNKGAGSKAAYEAAKAVRESHASKNYGAIRDYVINTDKDLNLLMTRPSMELAVRTAENLAKEKGDTFVIGKDMPEQIIPSLVLDASGRPVGQHIIPAQYAKMPLGSLQYVKMALDKMISKPKDFGIEAMSIRDIAQTRTQLIEWLNKNGPKKNGKSLYEEANKQYAMDSLPLQQMDLWGVLKDKFIPPTGKEAPGSYLRAARDEAKLIKDATGFRKGTDVSDIFNAEQSSLAAKLAAEMEMELLKKRMSGEVNIPGIGKAAEGLEPQLPNMLMRETMIANFMLRQLAKNANVDVNLAASRILQDPKLLAGVLKQVKPAHRSQILKTIKDKAFSNEAAVAAVANTRQSTGDQ